MGIILGYIGSKKNIKFGISLFKKIKNPFYDSVGFAFYDPQKKEIFLLKKAGKINLLEKIISKSDPKPTGNVFILQARWASRGEISDRNAQPHFDCKKEIYLVHNGIIENYKELREELEKEGHKFSSDTDSEVLVHLIEKYYEGKLEIALKNALKEVNGTYGIVVISKKEPEKIVCTKLSSPLFWARRKKEILISSESSIFDFLKLKSTSLNEKEIAVLTADDFYVVKEKRSLKDIFPEEKYKKGFSHFMLKEIFEIPEVIKNTFRGRILPKKGEVRLGGLDKFSQQLKNTEKIFLFACGTSYFAAEVGEFFFEELSQISAETKISSEFYKNTILNNKEILSIFISQSGETKDTLDCLREVKKKKILTLGITNVIGSTQAKETDFGVYTYAGPEFSIASTKVFTAQLTALLLLAVYFANLKKINLFKTKKILFQFLKIPSLIKRILENSSQIEKITKKYKDFKNFYLLGKKYNFPITKEGALKLKETSYLHAEGYPTNEIRHGPIALLDKDFAVVAICLKDSSYKKAISVLKEVKKRKARLLVVANFGDKKIKEIADDIIYIPKTLEILNPFLSVVPLYLFAYYLAKELKRPIDKPRGLTKAVTY